jgi:hypothetical protein
VVIEDAAQGLGATLGDDAGGSLADWSVLSFGRGKGVNGGGGGALLMRGAVGATDSNEGRLPQDNIGLRPWLMTSAQGMIGYPALYRIPASLPFLHLGEMIYKDAPEPAAIAPACAVMAMSSWISLPARIEAQRVIAAAYIETVSPSRAIRPLPASRPSWLRYPVRVSEHVDVPKHLGVLRPYPAALAEQRHIGAVALRQELVTLPTHELMRSADVERVRRWLERN